MSNERRLTARLEEFHSLASTVWAAYQDVGPGRVDATLFAAGEQLASQIVESLADETTSNDRPANIDGHELRSTILKVADLAMRCATRSEGLCFITGEAGLVPRRDWQAAMEEGLVVIEEAVAQLQRR